MIRLYIENYEADITEGFSHQITYAIDDLNNLDSKATAFSKTIVLPGTNKNNNLLGNIFEFTNSNFTADGPNVFYNFNASKSAKCRLEINGLQLIKGVLRLLEIIHDGDSIEYEVAIFGELGGFVSKLSNKKLEDLDFSAYNHTYTISNITSYWNEVSYYKYKTGYSTLLFNSATNYAEIYNVDLTKWLSIGEIINFYDVSDDNNLGDFVVISYNYDKIKTTIVVDHSFSTTYPVYANYIITFKNFKGFGIYYPLIDYGNFSTDKANYKYKTFRPALFIKEYLHKIITDAGYTYESKFLDSNFFCRLIVPHNERFLLTNKSDLFLGRFNYQEFNSSTNTIDYTVNDSLSINKLYGDTFTTSDNKTFTYIGLASTTISINLIAYFHYTIYGFGTEGRLNFIVELYKNGNPTGLKYELNDRFHGDLDFTATFNGDLFINTNDTLEYRYTFRFRPNKFSRIKFLTNQGGELKYTSQYPILTSIDLDDLVEVNKVIPKNILQKDFFTSILKMFYLMVTEDKYREKHLKIEPWTWFFDLNSSSYIDWSMKLDRSQPIKIKPMSEATARYYEVKYKSETDYFNDRYKKKFNEGYGDVKFDNQLEFSKESQTTEVIFAATPLVGYSGEDKVVSTIFKWDGKNSGQNEETINSIIRILQAKNIDGVNEWSILNDGGGTISSYIEYPYAGHFDDPDVPGSDINFGALRELFFSLSAGALGNNLFNTFYSSYLAEITDKDSRLVTAKFKLNDTDVFNLDFSKFIYLDGVLYRLSKVVDYTPGEICTGELLRVIYTTYDNSVNASDNPEININGVIWTSKNYEGEYYRNGEPIPQITDDTEWENATEGAWCWYNNNSGSEYGKLYNWYAVNDARGFAPDGYDVPTQGDFDDLFTFVSNDGNKLKEAGTEHWSTNNGTNETKFAAFGGGARRGSGVFIDLKDKANFWTSDEYDATRAYYNALNTDEVITNDKKEKNYGYSIRLVKR